MSPIQPAPVLSPENAAFIQSGVAINIAARGPGNSLAVTRVYGCAVTADRCEVTLFVYPARCETLLEYIRATGVIAAVFSLPSSHQTLQLKSSTAEPVPVMNQDLETMGVYREAFALDLLTMGYSHAFTEAMVPEVSAGAVGIRFTPQEIFSQTPGPNAGQKLCP